MRGISTSASVAARELVNGSNPGTRVEEAASTSIGASPSASPVPPFAVEKFGRLMLDRWRACYSSAREAIATDDSAEEA